MALIKTMLGLIGSILGWLAGVALVLVAINVSISNSERMHLRFWPFDETLSLPVWLILFGALSIGLVAGSAIVWPQLIAGRLRNRQLRRQLEGRIKRLQAELDEAGKPADKNRRAALTEASDD